MGKQRKSSKNRDAKLLVLAAKISLLTSILMLVSELIKLMRGL